MKTFALLFSRNFPAKHPRAGELTMFVTNILHGEGKIHTIRGNYTRWLRIVREVQAGRGVLSLRYWTGTPYASPQQEFHQLTAADGVGIERLVDEPGFAQVSSPTDHNYRFTVDVDDLADNDGLNTDDFLNWFPEWGQENERAIIHFTPMRYASPTEGVTAKTHQGPVGPQTHAEHGTTV